MELCYNEKMQKVVARAWLVSVGMLIIATGQARAQVATSSSYILESSDFQALDLEGESESYGVTGGLNSLGDNVATAYPEETDFLTSDFGLYSGFARMLTMTMAVATESAATLEVSLDKMAIEMNNLSPGITAQEIGTVTVNSNSPAGYALYVQQNHQLQNMAMPGAMLTSRTVVPDTTCDDKSCTPTVAGTWENNDQAGFGYSVMGGDSLADFANGTKYRPFATKDNGENPVLIAQEEAATSNLNDRQTQVVYRTRVASDNEAGIYANGIIYTVIPSL